MKTKSTNKAERILEIDAFRGVAVLLMMLFHLCVDLRTFASPGVRTLFAWPHAFWAWTSSVIGSMFLITVGLAAVISFRSSTTQYFHHRRWRHLLRIAGAAGLVSIGSFIAVPSEPIYFGILHCIAVASVFVLLLVKQPKTCLALGLPLTAIGTYLYYFPVQNTFWFWLVPTLPIATSDWYPMIPWVGIALLGVFLGHTLYAQPQPRFIENSRLTNRASRFFLFLGKHALVIYLIHQPLFVALIRIIF